MLLNSGGTSCLPHCAQIDPGPSQFRTFLTHDNFIDPIRASVPERVAMLLTGHKSRAIFDRYNIINEQELLEAGDQLVAYLAQHAQAPCGRAHPAGPRPAPPLRLVRRTTA